MNEQDHLLAKEQLKELYELAQAEDGRGFSAWELDFLDNCFNQSARVSLSIRQVDTVSKIHDKFVEKGLL